jgi:PAS domain-containing protein
MVTAYGDEQLVSRVMRAGALDYMSKDDLSFLADLPRRILEAVTRYRLQNLNLLLSAAMNSARDSIMITDLQGTIQHVNPALEHLTGYRRDELVGQTPRLLRSDVHPAKLGTCNPWPVTASHCEPKAIPTSCSRYWSTWPSMPATP